MSRKFPVAPRFDGWKFQHLSNSVEKDSLRYLATLGKRLLNVSAVIANPYSGLERKSIGKPKRVSFKSPFLMLSICELNSEKEVEIKHRRV